jgi:hypothetical protein
MRRLATPGEREAACTARGQQQLAVSGSDLLVARDERGDRRHFAEHGALEIRAPTELTLAPRLSAIAALKRPADLSPPLGVIDWRQWRTAPATGGSNQAGISRNSAVRERCQRGAS